MIKSESLSLPKYVINWHNYLNMVKKNLTTFKIFSTQSIFFDLGDELDISKAKIFVLNDVFFYEKMNKSVKKIHQSPDNITRTKSSSKKN